MKTLVSPESYTPTVSEVLDLMKEYNPKLIKDNREVECVEAILKKGYMQIEDRKYTIKLVMRVYQKRAYFTGFISYKGGYRHLVKCYLTLMINELGTLQERLPAIADIIRSKARKLLLGADYDDNNMPFQEYNYTEVNEEASKPYDWDKVDVNIRIYPKNIVPMASLYVVEELEAVTRKLPGIPTMEWNSYDAAEKACFCRRIAQNMV